MDEKKELLVINSKTVQNLIYTITRTFKVAICDFKRKWQQKRFTH